jgi:release factor glutamine methyltransferase
MADSDGHPAARRPQDRWIQAESQPAAILTVGAAVTAGRQLLEQAGVETPRLDAELLLASVLGCGRERLVIDRDRVLDPAEGARYDDLLARRVAHEPIAYILGRRHFRRLTLAVDRRVLIPRPETELLVEVGLELPSGARVLDVGTGSGAVALALKDERPDLVVRGTDVSPDAVAVARGNAARLGLDVSFVEADLLDLTGGSVDAVLANLPYVPRGAPLPPEITRYEPPGALFAGTDGLDLVRRLVSDLRGPVVALAALEIGPEQVAEVSRLLVEGGFSSVEVRRDLAGLDRVVVGAA